MRRVSVELMLKWSGRPLIYRPVDATPSHPSDRPNSFLNTASASFLQRGILINTCCLLPPCFNDTFFVKCCADIYEFLLFILLLDVPCFQNILLARFIKIF